MEAGQDFIDLLLAVTLPRFEITHHVAQDGFQFFALGGDLFQAAIRTGEITDHFPVVAIHIHPGGHGNSQRTSARQVLLLLA